MYLLLSQAWNKRGKLSIALWSLDGWKSSTSIWVSHFFKLVLYTNLNLNQKYPWYDRFCEVYLTNIFASDASQEYIDYFN